MGRYESLFRLPSRLYIEGAPLLIAEGALLKDTITNNVVVQIKFKSISNKIIKALKSKIKAWDAFGGEVTGIDQYQYIDLNAMRGAEFGQNIPVVLPNSNARRYDVSCELVQFDDMTTWENDKGFVWESIKALEPLGFADELIWQYQKETSDFAKYKPIEAKDIWFCTCGNCCHSDEVFCTVCGVQKDKVFSALNVSNLIEHRNELLYSDAKSQKEKARTEQEYLFAINVFSQVLDYKDSKEQIEICKSKIEELKNYDKYMMAFANMTSADNAYNDREKIAHLKAANSIYSELGDYKDSKSQILINSQRINDLENKINEENEQRELVKKKKEKKFRIISISALIIVVIVCSLIFVIFPMLNHDEGSYLFGKIKFNESAEKSTWKVSGRCDQGSSADGYKRIGFTFTVDSGISGEQTKFYYVVKFPDGHSEKSDWYWEDKRVNDKLGVIWDNGIYSSSYSGPSGELTVKVYNKETGEFAGQASTYIE